jgi:DNA-binding NtrC family response regulator
LLDDTKKEVLLFDRQNIQRDLLTEMLTEIGCNVTAVKNENDCFMEFVKKNYHLFLFDQNIPDTNLNKFLAKLTKLDQFTPMAMMATLPIEFYDEKYGRSDVDFLIYKPFELTQLSKLVQEASELFQKLKEKHSNN